MRHLASSVRANVPPAVPEGEVMPSMPPAGMPRNMPQRLDPYNRHEQHPMHNNSPQVIYSLFFKVLHSKLC
jgi:hypothetical protein